MNDDPDIEKLLRALDSLIQAQKAQIDEAGEDLMIIVSIVRQKPIRPYYDEIDDLAVSLAFSRLPSTD